MNFFELKKKMLELIEASKRKSDILKTDEKALRRELLEVNKDICKVNSQIEKKDMLEKAKKVLASKFNELYPEEARIFNCTTLSLESKVSQLTKICTQKTEKILSLDETVKQLAKLEEEMDENEASKKAELMPMWRELKEIYEIEDFEDEIEIEIFDSSEEVSTEEKKDENLLSLMKELEKEMSSSNTQEEKKKRFFGNIFSKKNN